MSTDYLITTEPVWTGAYETACVKARQQHTPPPPAPIEPLPRRAPGSLVRAVAQALARAWSLSDGWLSLNDLADMAGVDYKGANVALQGLIARGQVEREHDYHGRHNYAGKPVQRYRLINSNTNKEQ